jgi:hypothetical protein
MSSPGSSYPTLYLPAEVARMLRCSEWWVKEQARHRRIPYCWIGGGYRFTDRHVAEIARLFEVLPAEPHPPAVSPAPRSPHRPGDPTTRLTARPPRRTRSAVTDAAA